MTKKVLDVGQCDADHSRITQVLSKHFDVELTRAHTKGEATELLKQDAFDLVLINRLLDINGDPGIDVLKEIKQDSAEVKVIVVSNYAEAQDAAVEAGAIRGFGKAALDTPETIELLKPLLT